MAKQIKETIDMSDQSAMAPAKKTRKPQGPRKPTPFYLFLKVDAGAAAGQQISVSKSFRDPRKMAEYFGTANTNGEQLVVVTPE